ncbi:ribose 5-phosphate isomerase B [Candidatus Woesearchaeota archaeon]|nr:ribose 5-phosphate isomerase B [Candidatus Woesearchaeota archaeon]
MKKEVIFIGSDHAGFRLKEKIKAFLGKSGYRAEDLGVDDDKKYHDYPKTAIKVAKKVAKAKGKGILVCGTGLGEAIVANKVRGIRATNCFNEYTALKSREHNDSNLLCLGARILKENEAKKITKIWLETNFSKEERHRRRVKQIKEMEKNMCR